MKASEAFDNVCALVAEKYKDDGWKYAKSSHWMTKKDKKFMYKVFFIQVGIIFLIKLSCFMGNVPLFR
ncbi:hypothetical protein PAECIP111890_05772 [Paenibacillus sp. JJ-223]|nr:hypothetical protein PAECIP111890_05772 [Paenibacillus sp. JJ-223]